MSDTRYLKSNAGTRSDDFLGRGKTILGFTRFSGLVHWI
jgi:hypothetical protein